MAVPQGKVEKSLHDALQRANDTTYFTFHRVNPDFCPDGPFSSVRLTLKVHGTSRRAQRAIMFNTLFKVDATNPEFDKAKEFIHRCKRKEWPPFHTSMASETNVMLAITSHILVHLSPEVTMEKRYSNSLSSLKSSNLALPKTLTTAPLGMGVKEAWHGNIDTRAKGGVVICQGEEGEELVYQSEDEDDESSESEGESSKSEGKHSYGTTVNVEEFRISLPQVVAICVVSSFTENANHPDMSALIPTILIDKESFRICLYDCRKDVLLLSNKKALSTNGHLSQSGIALIWAVLNHR